MHQSSPELNRFTAILKTTWATQ